MVLKALCLSLYEFTILPPKLYILYLAIQQIVNNIYKLENMSHYYTAQLERREKEILIGRERVTSESLFSDIDG